MTSPLEPDRQTRSDLTEQVLEFLADWFDRAQTMEAHGEDPTPEVLETLRQPPGESGRSLESILEDVDVAGESGIFHASGGHMSYIPNSGMYTAALADFLAAGLNRFTGVANAAPGFTAIEYGVVDWLTSIFELGPDASGLLVSGGSIANFTGIVTARVAKLGDHFTNGALYVTSHTHHSVAKAARLAGFRDDQIVAIDVDAQLRMDPARLTRQIASDRAAGLNPFMLIGSAGTTDTGTVDPLDTLADIAASEDLWFHVDGAYGGFFQLTRRGKEVLTGISRADSISLDPHKGLSIPFGVGAIVVKSERTLLEAHEGRGAYLRDDDSHVGLRDLSSLGLELTRPFRALSVWLPLQLHGVTPFRETLDFSLDLAQLAYERLKTINGVTPDLKPDLSIVAFGFDDDVAGRSALEAVNNDGRVHLSPTIVDGRFVLRIAILNRRTTADHIDHAIDIIEKTLIG